MSLPLLLLLFLSLSAKEITIASYNVENLFDLVESGNEYNLYKPLYNGWDLPSYQQKLRNCASVISHVNADIIMLQEIESERALKDLLHSRKLKKCRYKTALFGGRDDTPTTTAVALLSRYPLLSFKKHPIQLSEGKWSRPILEATLLIDSCEITLFGVHFPSKRAKESSRVTAASQLRSILDTLDSQTEFLILGDFNSDHDEAVNLLTGNMDDTKGVTGINHVLGTVPMKVGQEFRLATKKEVLEELALLYNPWQEKREIDQYSYIYRGELGTIDHILLSKSLLDNQKFTYKKKSFHHVIMGEVRKGLVPYRWQVRWGKASDKHKDYGYSDHLPICLKLTTQKEEYAPQPLKRGSFENSSEGWIALSNRVRLLRKSGISLDGSEALHLEGRVTKNQSVTKVTALFENTSPSFFIGGRGTVGVRIKKRGSRSWFYYSKGGQITKRSAYFTLGEKRWEEVKFPHELFQKGDMLTLEIRCKKDVVVDCYIDVCSLRGWER